MQQVISILSINTQPHTQVNIGMVQDTLANNKIKKMNTEIKIQKQIAQIETKNDTIKMVAEVVYDKDGIMNINAQLYLIGEQEQYVGNINRSKQENSMLNFTINAPEQYQDMLSTFFTEALAEIKDKLTE